jgi:genome maintenance exonuclease 1
MALKGQGKTRKTFKQMPPMNIIKDEEWGPVTYRGEGEDSRRYYTTPDGAQYPSVTTFLGFFEDPKPIQDWRERVGQDEADRISNRACERGETVHAALERYVLNDPSWNVEMAGNWQGMFNQIRRAVDRSLDAVVYCEHALYSDELELAGRVDLCGIWNGELAIIDFKNKSYFVRREYIEDYFLQCCIYAMMHHAQYGVLPKKLVILAAVEDGVNYNCQVFTENTEDYIPKIMAMKTRFDEMGGFEGPGIDWEIERALQEAKTAEKKASAPKPKKVQGPAPYVPPLPPLKPSGTTNLLSML